MKIVIVGCGRVGAATAETYDRNGHQVVIIDILTSAFDRLPSSFKGEALRGDGTDEDVLRRVGAEGADIFLALTEGDNRNVMAAQLAAEALGVGRVIAKINDPVRAAAYSELGIATVCRTGLMIDAIDGYLGLPSAGLPGMLAPSGSHHEPSHGLAETGASETGASGTVGGGTVVGGTGVGGTGVGGTGGAGSGVGGTGGAGTGTASAGAGATGSTATGISDAFGDSVDSLAGGSPSGGPAASGASGASGGSGGSGSSGASSTGSPSGGAPGRSSMPSIGREV